MSEPSEDRPPVIVALAEAYVRLELARIRLREHLDRVRRDLEPPEGAG